jgi:hypothetical protein
MLSASDADDNWTALIAPSTARFTDLGMSVSGPTFIQQRTQAGHRAMSVLCQFGHRTDQGLSAYNRSIGNCPVA